MPAKTVVRNSRAWAVKCMVDGALGSHGAWLFEPYDDLPGSRGLVVEPVDSIRATADGSC